MPVAALALAECARRCLAGDAIARIVPRHWWPRPVRDDARLLLRGQYDLRARAKAQREKGESHGGAHMLVLCKKECRSRRRAR